MKDVISPDDGKVANPGSIGHRPLASGEKTDGRFSAVEHVLPPKALAGPLHRHSREDEYTYVLEGNLAVLLGDEVVTAEAGTFVVKPRNQWHTYWNPTDEPCRILEIVSPAGFEHFLNEMDALGDQLSEEKAIELGHRYGLAYDMSSVPELCAQHGLWLGPVPPAE